MLATFCLRLALGLAASLLILPSADVAPRFYRVQFLVILGLLAGAMLFSWSTATAILLTVLVAAMLLCFAGSIVWMLEGSPGGHLLVLLTTFILAAAIPLRWPGLQSATQMTYVVVDDWTSAALLGSATAAMLMGHSYLIAPGMSIAPLVRLLVALFVAVLVRMTVAGALLWTWSHASHTWPSDLLLWLPVRWLVGFAGPLILGWMAWRCAGIRSTQSATGILYVVVVLCFIGELTGELLQGAWTGVSASQNHTMMRVVVYASSAW